MIDAGNWISLATGGGALAFTLVLKLIDIGGHRAKLGQLDKELSEAKERLKKCEQDLGLVSELKTQVAVLEANIRGEVKGLREMSERDTRELRHDISGIRQGMDKVTDMLLNGPRPSRASRAAS